ncbi:MAG: hypothetical protein M5R36_23260 [Deltaproteobacteria bacterium]|nr:hypothetical protein [Deltaproteobacteria bacterium]
MPFADLKRGAQIRPAHESASVAARHAAEREFRVRLTGKRRAVLFGDQIRREELGIVERVRVDTVRAERAVLRREEIVEAAVNVIVRVIVRVVVGIVIRIVVGVVIVVIRIIVGVIVDGIVIVVVIVIIVVAAPAAHDTHRENSRHNKKRKSPHPHRRLLEILNRRYRKFIEISGLDATG